MSHSAALQVLTPRQHSDQNTDACQALSQSLEGLHMAEHIERALRATGHGSLRTVEVAVRDRVVILSGRVPSYYLKQIAQATVLTVPGTHQVHNDLDVVPPN